MHALLVGEPTQKINRLKIEDGGYQKKDLHFMLTVEGLLALVLLHLLEQGLLLLLLVVAAASLLITVLTVEDEAAGRVPALLGVREVNRLSGSFHLFFCW